MNVLKNQGDSPHVSAPDKVFYIVTIKLLSYEKD